MKYVKPIDIRDKLRVGNVVPYDAVEICSFDNNINKITNSSTVSASTEKNLSQHKLVKLYETKIGISSKDSSIFNTFKEYSDDLGYSGTINLKDIEWKKRIETSKEFKECTITLNVNDLNNIQRNINRNIDGYSGNLSLTKISITGTDTRNVEYIVGELFKLYSELVVSSVELSVSIYKELNISNKYSGNVYKKYFDKSIYQNSLGISIISMISGKINNSFPSSITQNGLMYLPTGEFTDKTIDAWVKHYGVCRYWGGGGNSSNNYYGDPDYKYRVNGWTAKGYMNGNPTPTLNKYGHKMKITNNKVSSSKEKYPEDSPGGYYGPSNGITDGLQWTYDIDEANKYGGSNGSVWMSDYWNKSGGIWPPPGYENDYTGKDHYSNVQSGGSSPINHTNSICTRPGAQKTSLAGFWNYGGFYCKWFRDVLLFYKGKTTTTIQEGKYISYTTSDKGYTSNNITLHAGLLSCTIKGTTNVITSSTVVATYSGILTKDTVVYDAKAIYEGLVYKKVFVDTSIPSPNKYINFIIDTDGYIKDNNKNKTFKSQFVRLTNVSKNGVPMLYKYIMNNKIHIPNGPTVETYTETKYVSLKYDINIIDNIEYLLKLTPSQYKDVYTCAIYTNKCIGYTDNVIAEYVDGNNTITEIISSEHVLIQGIDYKSTTNDNINYSIKIANSGSTTIDTRRKIQVSYKIKTIDGSYQSNLITCDVINKKYALENEKLYFLYDYCNVSPVYNSERISAREIIAIDNGINVDNIINKKFYIEVSGSNSHLVDAYTDVDGNGFVYICTYEDTGFPITDGGTTSYTGIHKQYVLSESINGIIYDGLYGVLENQNGINILSPYSDNEFKNWYARITYYPFEIISNRNNTNINSTYILKEYINDSYHSNLGKPYKQITEKAIIVSPNMIRLTRNNILFKQEYMSIHSDRLNKDLNIIGFDINENIIIIDSDIYMNDTINVTYIYAETSYEYTGYGECHLNLNPNYLHTYVDPDSCSIKPSYELFNKTIYIFIKPNEVVNTDTNEVIIDNTNSYHIYHKIDDSTPVGIYDLLIGIVSVTPTSSILNTDIHETTSIGGGIKDKYIEKNIQHLDGFYDISTYSEKAIQKSGTFIVEVDDNIDSDIVKNIINRQKPVGVLPVFK